MSKTRENTSKKVFVGMSGGVDSSVSAALLQKEGYEVTGVFIKVWQPDWIECTWREDRRDAMRVAAHLGIPFITLDLEKEYKKDVIDYMISEYSAGRTPNPDIMCNQHIKFGAFYNWAMKKGADFVATGHYARIKASPDGDGGGLYSLLAGSDPNKDQSYFLWTLKQDQLSKIIFPVGDLPKPEVRKLAHQFGLPNADKKDSQGLCFIGKIDVKKFLGRYIKNVPGNVLDEKGNVIGKHPGSLFLTIGERHGFTITKKTPTDKPYYVVGKDVEKNTITVSTKKNGASDKKEQTINSVNWIGKVPKIGSTLTARSRYRQPLQDIRIESVNGDRAAVESKDVLTPGQSLVIYDEEVCMGGGIIS